MPNARELLNIPAFQRNIARNAERWLNLERFFQEQVVVFDRGNEDFWTTVMNSPRKGPILERIVSGEVVPINADALSDIAQVHSILHVYIAESGKGVPTIPTIVNINGSCRTVGRYRLSKEIPSVVVKKASFRDGKMVSHRGEGVSIVRIGPSNKESHLPKNLWEFLQPFVVPPDEFVRDIRVYSVGGEPIDGVIRRAQKPLTPQNLTGEVLPTIEQYPSAQCPGPSEYLTGELREKIFGQAKKVFEILDEKIRSRKRQFSPYTTWGFGSIDFLLDADGMPLPVDFDISPSITTFGRIDKNVAEAMAAFLGRLSNIGDLERKILLIGWPEDHFLQLVIENLRSKFSEERIVLQESVVTRALRQSSQLREKSPKIGRNDPCWCGSGKKWKRCHYLISI